jgi:RNA polymerase sigma-70 factor (ECF subfamily)
MYRYIVSLLGDADAAWDVLQETNRVLLEKRKEFAAGTNFVNWALTVAQFQTRAWLRNQSRDRLLVTPEIVDVLADEARRMDAHTESKLDALKHCLERLPRDHRELIHRRYARAETLTALSKRSGRSVNALKQQFFRLRGALLHCIERRLETG